MQLQGPGKSAARDRMSILSNSLLSFLFLSLFSASTSLQLSSPPLRVPQWRSAIHSITLEFFAPGRTEVGMTVEVLGDDGARAVAQVVSHRGENIFIEAL